jgi:hypothetical protein
MIQAMITCPRTGKAVPTGFKFGNLAAFKAMTLTNNKVKCAACREMHLLDDSNVKAFPVGDMGLGG